MINAVLVAPIGMLGIETQQEALVGIHFLLENVQVASPASPLAREVIKQLQAYFDQRLFEFSLPLSLSVSNFSERVLNYLRTIPAGSTQSYGEVARVFNTSPRAIGGACRHNPIPIIIPCHRVVARNHVGGYAGAMTGSILEIKKWLLAHEKTNE